MKPAAKALIAGIVFVGCLSGTRAAPLFGASASGTELSTPGIVSDGGAGSASASISRPDFGASARFLSGATYLPELKAYATNASAFNDDDITRGEAAAYQVFTSSVAQTVQLDVGLHGIVEDQSTDVSFVLADVYVYGGSAFQVSDSPICADGRLGLFLFDATYFCGLSLGRSNLFIGVGDVTRNAALSFQVAAAQEFGVFAILTAAASGGTADATQTLTLNFTSDAFLAPVSVPGAVPSPASIWLLGPGLLGLLAIGRARSSAGRDGKRAPTRR